jgi:hypothetical protein
VRKNKEKELLVVADGDEYDDNEDGETAYPNADAARWLMSYLGECFPADFKKPAQRLDMPIHQGTMEPPSTVNKEKDSFKAKLGIYNNKGLRYGIQDSIGKEISSQRST